MKNSNIQRYINDFLKSEFDLHSAFSTNGELEKNFIKLQDVVRSHYIFIKILSKQQDTHDKTGLLLKWTEFQNTIWRFILGNYHRKYKREMDKIENVRLSKFVNFYKKISSEHFHNEFNLPGRLFIDVTGTSQFECVTGIQRVVIELCKALLGSNVFFIYCSSNGTFKVNPVTLKLEEVNFVKNDVLLMLDAATDYFDALKTAMLRNKRAGGKNVALVYDLIPLNSSVFCDPIMPYKFYLWFKSCPCKSDLILCNSEVISSEVREIVSQLDDNNEAIPCINTIPLGADFTRKEIVNYSQELQTFREQNPNIFLSVGTLEPRKGYSICLDAFEQAWRAKSDITYVIIGRYGWSQEHLRDRILQHPEYGKKLIWMENANDTDLSFFYEYSRALIFSSMEEGYGLPLIEAAHYGLPAIVSDISVFREIAGDQATYFNVADPDSLAHTIIKACNEPKIPPNIKVRSWTDMKIDLLAAIDELF